MTEPSPDKMLELKPCPFCGQGMAYRINEGAPIWVHPDRLNSQCWMADAYVIDEMEGEGGIAEWNTRAPDPHFLTLASDAGFDDVGEALKSLARVER